MRYNYPYLGKADGFTTYLRKQFQTHYLGIEIEINQKYAKANVMSSELKGVLFLALKTLLNTIKTEAWFCKKFQLTSLTSDISH